MGEAATRGGAIFIGYRREDSADVAGRIYDRLRSEFGADSVFKDVDNLPYGVDFGAHILSLVPQCRAFLAVIGPHWREARDGSGVRRIDDPADWVRIEIETALAAPGLQIFPVLVNGAAMPSAEDLPEGLRPLARRNAAIVRRDPDFHNDMNRLVAALGGGRRATDSIPNAPARGPSAAAWAVIAESLDIADYEEFLKQHAGMPEALLASRHRRQLEAWAVIDKNDPDAIAAFRDPSYFEALQSEIRRALQRARSQARSQISTEDWLQPLAAAKGDHVRDMASKAIDWFRANGFGVRVSDSQDSVVAELVAANGVKASPFLLRRSTGKLETSLQYLKETRAFADEGARLALLERLKKIPGVAASDKSTGWPTIGLIDLVNDDVWKPFAEIATDVRDAICGPGGGDGRGPRPPALASVGMHEPTPTAEDFRKVLRADLCEAEERGLSSIEINSGDLHRKVGGYQGSHHAMPTCCSVMRQEMRDGDAIVSSPPKGAGASLTIQYQLPR